MSLSNICESSSTPIMEQYREIKELHKDYLLFYRIGDFYELFFNDAKIASKVLNIVLTKKNRNSDNEVPMCGVPCQNVSYYINSLLKKGYSIAICEQLESPKEAKKRGYKSLIKREVVQIITPGTLMNSALLDSKNSNFLLSIANYKNNYSIAWVELTASDFYVSDCTYTQVINEISRLNPKEILIPNKIKDNFDLLLSKKICSIRNDNIFDYKSCLTRIEEFYDINSINSLGLYSNLQIIAAGSLIEYISHTQKDNLPKLKPLKKYQQNFFMEIDSSTRDNLEINPSKYNKEFNLLYIIDKTITASGGRLLKSRLNTPLVNANIINKRLECVDFFYRDKELRKKMREYLKYFPDIQRSMSAIFVNKAFPKDLNAIKNGLKIAKMISELVNRKNDKLNNEIHNLTSQIFGYDQLVIDLEEALVEDECYSNSQSFIKANYDEDLDQLYHLKVNSRETIIDIQTTYRLETGVRNLKISKNNILGYFVEITKLNAEKLDNNKFIHKQTLGNTIRYITKELKNLDSILVNCNIQINEIENIIFGRLCKKVKSYFSSIDLVNDSIANLDFFSSLAEFALQKKCIRPLIDKSKNLLIQEGRHLVVEHYHKKSFIANNINMNEKEKVLLVTGANMAGKTTFLRQNVLICILAHIGSYVPATNAYIGLVDKIFSRVGAYDDISKGQSTFMVEMTETAYILNNATEKSLVVLDEVGRGTSTYDGISIAYSVLKYLHDRIKCRTLFSTHYHELPKLGKNMCRARNYKMDIRLWNKKVIFLYKVISGIANKSYGIHVAELAGIPKDIINHAKIVLEKLENEQ